MKFSLTVEPAAPCFVILASHPLLLVPHWLLIVSHLCPGPRFSDEDGILDYQISNATLLQDHHCAMVALALVKSNLVTAVSDLTCTKPRLREAPDVLLCVKPEDMLVIGACLQLREDHSHISFKPTDSALSKAPQLHRATHLRLKYCFQKIKTSIIKCSENYAIQKKIEAF